MEAAIQTRVGGGTIPHRLPVIHEGSVGGGGNESFVGGLQTRLYADHGTQVRFYLSRSSTDSTAGAWVTLSGYLAPVP